MNKNGNRIDADNVFKKVKQFFEQEEESHEGDAHIPCPAIDKLPLLRIACMGNAEKTIQGELFHYLRCKHKLNAVIECGYRDFDDSFDRHIDIMVFDNDWSPIVSIELKHFSPHQGTIKRLLDNLKVDYIKRRQKGEGLPLIQVGLYTQIDSVSPRPFQILAFPLLKYYRFLTAKGYNIQSKCGNLNSEDMKAKFKGDVEKVKNFPLDPKLQYSQPPELFRGRDEEFKVVSSPNPTLTVTGRVNWLAMLAS